VADELKIPVSIPGGKDAEETLARIARAEKGVGEAGREAGEKLGRSAGQAAGKTQELDASTQRLVGTLKGVLGALGIQAGVAGAVAAINRAVEEWQARMEAIARLSREAGQNMVAFAMMQEPGVIGARAKEAAAAGARWGVAPGQAWETVQALQSQLGSYPAGLAAAGAAWELSRASVPPQAAQQAVALGAGLGLTPEEAARAVYAAGEASSLSAAEMAAAAPQGLPIYGGIGGGPVFGYQVMAGLSKVYSGELGTMTKAAGITLSTAEGTVGKMWRRLGVTKPGEDPMAQLRALKDAGITTAQDLSRAGVTEQRQQMALSVLLGDLPGFEATAAKVAETFARPGVIGERLAGAEAELPEMRQAREMAELEAEIHLRDLYDPAAPAARERDMDRAARYARMQKMGYGEFLSGDGRTSAPGSFIRTVYGLWAHWWRGTSPEGQTMEEILQGSPDEIDRLLRSGGGGTTYQGGVHFHGAYEDPAGRPAESPMR